MPEHFFEKKLSSAIASFYILMFSFILFDDYLSNVTRVSFFGKAASMAFFFISIMTFFIYKKYSLNKKLFNTFALFICYVVLILIFNSFMINYKFFYFPSFLYEVYKLSTPFIMLTMLFFDDKLLKKIVILLIYLFFFFVSINLFVIVLQHVFGANIVKFIGMNLAFQFRNNRPSGLTTSANTIGDTAVFIFVFFLILKENIKEIAIEKYERLIRIGAALSSLVIIFSTSKHAILIFFVYFIIKNKFDKKKMAQYFLLICLIGSVMILLNIMGIRDKLEMYYYFIASFKSLDISRVELRLLSIFDGVKIFINHFPFGTGLGTWGDFSQSFNNNAQFWGLRNKMSDIYLIHLLVEQGIFIVFYAGIIVYTLYKKGVLGNYLLVAILLASFFTMGFSSSIFPHIFSLCVVLLEYIKVKRSRIVNCITVESEI